MWIASFHHRCNTIRQTYIVRFRSSHIQLWNFLVFRITSFTDLCWFLKYLTVISDAYVSSCVCTGVFAISLGGGNVFFKWDSLAVRSQLIRRLIQLFFVSCKLFNVYSVTVHSKLMRRRTQLFKVLMRRRTHFFCCLVKMCNHEGAIVDDIFT